MGRSSAESSPARGDAPEISAAPRLVNPSDFIYKPKPGLLRRAWQGIKNFFSACWPFKSRKPFGYVMEMPHPGQAASAPVQQASDEAQGQAAPGRANTYLFVVKELPRDKHGPRQLQANDKVNSMVSTNSLFEINPYTERLPDHKQELHKLITGSLLRLEAKSRSFGRKPDKHAFNEVLPGLIKASSLQDGDAETYYAIIKLSDSLLRVKDFKQRQKAIHYLAYKLVKCLNEDWLKQQFGISLVTQKFQIDQGQTQCTAYALSRPGAAPAA